MLRITYLYKYVEYMFMHVIIEWFDENHRTLYRKTSDNLLYGEDRGEIVVKPPVPKVNAFKTNGGTLTDHGIELIDKHFTDKIVGFRVRVLPDDEK